MIVLARARATEVVQKLLNHRGEPGGVDLVSGMALATGGCRHKDWPSV